MVSLFTFFINYKPSTYVVVTSFNSGNDVVNLNGYEQWLKQNRPYIGIKRIKVTSSVSYKRYN